MTEHTATFNEVTSRAVEIRRIMSTGALWSAAGMLTPALMLGPLLASGWRPSDLPLCAEVGFWLGAAVAGLGLALLIWAACPVLAFGLDDAYRQKAFSIRGGIVLNVSGMVVLTLVLLLSPAG